MESHLLAANLGNPFESEIGFEIHEKNEWIFVNWIALQSKSRIIFRWEFNSLPAYNHE